MENLYRWIHKFLDKFGASEVYIDARERVVIESKGGNRLYIAPPEMYLYIPLGSEEHVDIWLLRGDKAEYVGTEGEYRIFPLEM